MVRVGIVGASGYTALELIKILLRHEEVEITALSSRQEGSPSISAMHQSLYGRLDLRCEDLTPEELADRVDVAFCALPHVASMQAIPKILARGRKVIDLSADYRLKDAALYEKWYQHAHTDLAGLGEAVYGLPELFRSRIPGARLIANPGCYTSTSILALAPLLVNRLISPEGIIIDAKSGVSGAGRTPKLGNLYSECNESLSAYSVGGHRHMPEIEAILTEVSNQQTRVVFTPHLIPMDRGILCTIYPKTTQILNSADLLEMYREFYRESPFIRIVPHLPSTKDSAYTNFCDITVRFSGEQLIVIACLDNLIKGASGVAVQNLNLMMGFPETKGFPEIPS